MNNKTFDYLVNKTGEVLTLEDIVNMIELERC